ncbi:uncharacterized protein LOC119687964 isoform X2 [Teleopsis dalmanni]|uniref:uncharacterized protein LOC119687964 isoform X2 n=1 Tax=Teleopsis dalmanni TaxID=139649 RepID=UPI0018CE78B8|nr:uncharacterized protein LOC119687964 isoform X2 [Teleopsis dalmanni]
MIMENLSKEIENNATFLKKSTDTTERYVLIPSTGPPPVVSCASEPNTWLTTHVNNNNNSHGTLGLNKKLSDENMQKQNSWNCESCEAVGVSSNYKHASLDAACAGIVEDEGGGASYVDPLEIKQNGSTASYTTQNVRSMTTIPEFVMSEEANEYYAGGAASLTPPCTSHSNRTSISNSTENLSYSSDIFCPDDLILLDNGDIEGEELSLNSDDCVYAYRGDGSDFELAMEGVSNRHVDAGFGDDETDFLEMDYEPDPLSEVEYDTIDRNQRNDTLLVQRDACHLSGRHSANNMNLKVLPTHRQHFSSPIDDLPPPKALQSQTMLGKNFARISLHLDQIKGDSGDSDCYEVARNDGISVLGAKPKRLSSSISSSTSSKNSSKSRSSLRSFLPIPMGNNSFDERSASCTEFRSAALPDDTLSTCVANCEDLSTNDETCLDCLEREFLVNTIGKAIDSKECPKCRKRKTLLILPSSYVEATYTKQGRCRSGSPLLFTEDILYNNKVNEFFNPCGRTDWSTNYLHSSADKKATSRHDIHNKLKNLNEGSSYNQRRTNCDNYGGEQMLKNLFVTEKEIVTISTVNFNEESLVQALDQLHITYDSELIKAFFKYIKSDNQPIKTYKNIKHYILHQSKKNMNHPKFSRLIQMATFDQVKVEYVKDAAVKKAEMTSISVFEVLQQWCINKNIEVLRKMERRFVDANVLGKVANLIRQNMRSFRDIPSYINIPQYYDPGYLKITKLC